MRRIKLLLIIIPIILVLYSIQGDMRKSNVFFCYGKIKAELIKDYKYVVVESKHFSSKGIKVLKSQNQKVFAYISLGEVNKNSVHYNDLKNVTLGKNKNWDSYYIDLNSKKATSSLLSMVDEIFAFGYDGLFLDNIDNFTIHGPQKYQTDKVVALIKQIKEKYPKKLFIQNAGLELASQTAPYIDIIAVESVATNYDFKNKKCRLSEDDFFKKKLNQINDINVAYDVPFILIEYADSAALAEKVYERVDATDYDFFVGSIDLQSFPEFK